MPISRLLNLLTATVAVVALAATSSSAAKPAEKAAAAKTVGPKVAISPAALAQRDEFAEGIKSANRAVSLSQSANSPQDWNEVAVAWLEAATWMQAVPPGTAKRALAQKKVLEYLRNYTVAQQKAAYYDAQLPFPTFNSDILDEQLRLYLSYLAAFGPPDILIVGSSRALQGVDPKALQQALAERGYSGLQVFNFSVNGATAQVVDFKLRELLSPKQLPRLIVWADGVRAFNDGREDRTYDAIASSPGYQNLLAGIRPTLNSATFPQTPVAFDAPSQEKSLKPTQPTTEMAELLSPFYMEAQSLWAIAAPPIFNQSAYAIDASGFQAVSARFNPASYYRQTAKIPGQYDGDYAYFQLGGKQAIALNSVVNFTRNRRVPLVVVNLPLTEDYLDSVRSSAERQFVQYMQNQAREKGFIFRNLSQPSLNQNNYFADPSHINLHGAAAVARYLARDSGIPWPRAKR